MFCSNRLSVNEQLQRSSVTADSWHFCRY